MNLPDPLVLLLYLFVFVVFVVLLFEVLERV